MNVQELIDSLTLIEDKTQDVAIFSEECGEYDIIETVAQGLNQAPRVVFLTPLY